MGVDPGQRKHKVLEEQMRNFLFRSCLWSTCDQVSTCSMCSLEDKQHELSRNRLVERPPMRPQTAPKCKCGADWITGYRWWVYYNLRQRFLGHVIMSARIVRDSIEYTQCFGDQYVLPQTLVVTGLRRYADGLPPAIDRAMIVPRSMPEHT